MALGKLPVAGPNDEFTTWSWLKKLSSFVQGLYYPSTSSTANFTMGLNFFYPVDATSGNIVVTLPIAAKQIGKIYVVKKTDSSTHTVTVTPDTTTPDLIDGGSTRVLSIRYDTVYFLSDGVSNWWTLVGDALISNSQLALMGAATIKGNPLGSTAVPQDMSGAVTTALLSVFGTGGSHAKGLAPDPGSGGGSTKFLREDATWATPASSGMSQFIVVTATGAGTTGAAPAGTNAVEIILQGSGAGGITTAGAAPAGGGASGEFMRRTVPVTAGNTYNYVVAVAGAAAANGNPTTFTGDNGTFTALGGKVGAGAVGGIGAGRSGPAGGTQATPGNPGAQAVSEGVDAISGASGGGGGTNATNTPGGAGGGCEENGGGAGGLGSATPLPGGGGGGSSRFGIGGVGGAGGVAAPAVVNTTAYGVGGGGGGGGTGHAGAAGIQGVLMYRWV